MFGTIGHARIKSGSNEKLQALMDEWTRTIRPTIPGSVLQLTSNVAGKPEKIVFVALMQDETTYRALAADPRQDDWFRRTSELIDGEVRWEDVEMEITLHD